MEPENQEQLVHTLVEATEQTMKNMSGFVFANIHKSLDGKTVINYAQWKNREAFEAMTSNPDAAPHMKASAALAKFDPILCEVVESVGIPE